MISVLFIDDDKLVLEMVKIHFQKKHTIYTCTSAEEGFQILDTESIDLVVTDINLPGMNGMQVLQKIKEDYDTIECILMSAQVDVELAADSIQAGAADYFKKPLDHGRVNLSILKAANTIALRKRLRSARLAQELSKLKDDAINGLSIIGNSAGITKLKSQMHKIAQTDDTAVLVTGESGTGKELVAKGIHEISNRAKYNFVAVNMSAIPEQLFESEFFGHKKGAFTGATHTKPGWFEVAQNGTLFLDEIGEMPLQQQAKLLRVIESKQFTPVGAQSPIDFNIRIIAATNRSTQDMSRGNDFRVDLYHRLSTLELHISPLRERKEDTIELVKHFVDMFCKKHERTLTISEEFYLACESYDFPGNIRELRNCIERSVILSEGETLKNTHLPFIKSNTFSNSNGMLPTLDLPTLEKMAIEEALKQVHGNKSKASELLGIKWNALHRKIEKWGITS